MEKVTLKRNAFKNVVAYLVKSMPPSTKYRIVHAQHTQITSLHYDLKPLKLLHMNTI